MKALLAILFMLFVLPAHAQQATVVAQCGQAQPVGALTNWTMDAQGRACMGQGVVLSCQQSVNYLARTAGGNEGGNAANISALICGLVADGLIDGSLAGAAGCGTYFDGLYIFAQQNRADASLNLCGTSYPLTVDAATVFTAYAGFNSFTVGMTTGYNPSASSGRKWALTSAGFGAWVYQTPVLEAPAIAGTFTANASYGHIDPRFTGNQFYGRVNNNVTPSAASPQARGLYGVERSDASGDTLYYNGASLGLKAGATVQVDTGFNFGRVTAGGQPTTNTLSMGYMGAPLGAAKQAAFYARLRTYMTAVGVP